MGIVTKKIDVPEDELIDLFYGGNDDYELVDEGEWEVEHKYQFKSNRFKDKNGDFWVMGASRSGDYYSDYNTEIDREICQVTPVKVEVTEWHTIEVKEGE